MNRNEKKRARTLEGLMHAFGSRRQLSRPVETGADCTSLQLQGRLVSSSWDLLRVKPYLVMGSMRNGKHVNLLKQAVSVARIRADTSNRACKHGVTFLLMLSKSNTSTFRAPDNASSLRAFVMPPFSASARVMLSRYV